MKLTVTSTYSHEPAVTPVDRTLSKFEFQFFFAIVPWINLAELKLEYDNNTYLHFEKINSEKGLVSLIENQTKSIHNYTYCTLIELVNSFDMYRRKPEVYKRLMHFISPEDFAKIESDSNEILGSSAEKEILQLDSVKEEIENKESLLTIGILIFIGVIILFILKNA
ncbi:MAG: hypothetical protein AB8B53_04840 [Flavobacteriales bacterium]